MPQTPILSQVETALLDLLAPLITDAHGTDGKVRQIQVESFQSPEDMQTLLDKYQSRMPGGFLGLPSGQIPQLAIRAVDLNLEYLFLAGWSEQATTPARRDARRLRVFQFVDDFASAIVYKRPTAQIAGTACKPNWIRLSKIETAENDTTAAVLMTFTVEVRNWTPNELER